MADLSKIKLNGVNYNIKDAAVPSWAKAETKPSYTYSEVGAAASSHTHGSITNAGAITSNTALANGDRLVFSDSSDSNLLKRSSITFGTSTAQYLANNGTWQNIPTTLPASDVSDWAKASTKPTYTAAEVGAMATTHDANVITASDITNWNSKTNNTGTVTSVRVQATSPVQSSTNTAQSTTLNTTISLASGYGDTQNPYASKTAKYVLAAPNASNGVPTFRALVASDLPSIGNITNAGDITATATIASGDRLIINDESASKVINSTITFGTSTTQYLANNGTWQNAYDDSALAARVTALEQLEWATYYSGRQNPANSLGNNGDIYLQY